VTAAGERFACRLKTTVFASLLAAFLLCPAAGGAEPALRITGGGSEHEFSAAALLARPDRISLHIPADVSYGRAMDYVAVPLLGLLADSANRPLDTLEAWATDGFASQIPIALVLAGARGGSVAWIAVEEPAHPWPALPKSSASAGPFYLVWEHPERSGIQSEQWPYGLATLALVESPEHRWPQIALPAEDAADAGARRGEQVFVAQCFPCHRLFGAGNGEMGPDLGVPMAATAYLTDAGLRAIIRDPRAVRAWPAQRMPAFDRSALQDADLDAVIAYLHAITNRRAKGN
jgi:mono/diheme cytochrome c family protein